jgi:hypothetical protein
MNKISPGPWEARVGRGSTALYIAGTEYAVAVGLRQADAELIARAPAMLAALRGLPEDIDMFEHNPEDGPSYFCCGSPVSFGFHGRTGKHGTECWYVAAQAAIAGLRG